MLSNSFVNGLLKNTIDKLHIRNKRQYEVKKFDDRKRKCLVDSIVLTCNQEKEIDNYYLDNYGETIPYIWHRHCMAFGSEFDVRFFPEYLLIPEFEHFMNLWTDYIIAFEDKNVLPFFAKTANVKTPSTIVSCSKGMFRDSDYRVCSRLETENLLRNVGEVFIKPTTDTSSGRGCIVADFKNGVDLISGNRVDSLLEKYGIDFVVQEKVVCREDIRRLYEKSVNTFRIVTYRWIDEINYWPSIMRIGRGNSVIDNAHAGGLFIGINNQGYLKSRAITEYKDEFFVHPDTQVAFEGYHIDGFEYVLAAAKKMHEMIPQIGLISWDFTINSDNQPVLIEANLRNHSVWLSQLANLEPAFGDKTDDVLRWMRKMKRTKVDDRAKYSFGKCSTL